MRKTSRISRSDALAKGHRAAVVGVGAGGCLGDSSFISRSAYQSVNPIQTASFVSNA